LPATLRDRLKVVGGNIEDSEFVTNVVRGHEVVIHLAALVGIPYSYAAPRSYVRTNVEGTLNVIEAARQLGTKRVVHTSTSETYGTARYAPMDEDHPLRGHSPYAASKIGADKIVEAYFRSFGTPIVTVRPFNTFGPRQTARAFIPTIVAQALSKEAIHLGSLSPERDMTYVSDTVDGLIRAAATPDIEGETIHLGTGQTLRIGEWAQRILSLMGCTKPVVHDAARDRPENSEVMRLVSDNRKAQRVLQWSPRTDLDDGLRRTIDFVTANPGLYAADRYTI
ncbi:MAG: hypothetical protein JWO25_3581, partial [Alphaproteobacteria bacterium]|nr:hypothetical protein [Alphaproteobacteria bacterium]